MPQRSRVRAEDLRYEKFILSSQDCFSAAPSAIVFEKNGVEMQVKLSLDSSLIRQYVKLGHGVSVLPLSVVQADVDWVELSLLSWQGEQFICIAQTIIPKKDWVAPKPEVLC